MLLPLLSDQVRRRGYGVMADASPFLLIVRRVMLFRADANSASK